MKHLKKLTALFLAAALALSMSACGGASSRPGFRLRIRRDGARRLTMLVPNNTNQYIKFDEREDYPCLAGAESPVCTKGPGAGI